MNGRRHCSRERLCSNQAVVRHHLQQRLWVVAWRQLLRVTNTCIWSSCSTVATPGRTTLATAAATAKAGELAKPKRQACSNECWRDKCSSSQCGEPNPSTHQQQQQLLARAVVFKPSSGSQQPQAQWSRNPLPQVVRVDTSHGRRNRRCSNTAQVQQVKPSNDMQQPPSSGTSVASTTAGGARIDTSHELVLPVLHRHYSVNNSK